MGGYTVAYPKSAAARVTSKEYVHTRARARTHTHTQVRSVGNMITALLTIALTAIATAIFTASTGTQIRKRERTSRST